MAGRKVSALLGVCVGGVGVEGLGLDVADEGEGEGDEDEDVDAGDDEDAPEEEGKALEAACAPSLSLGATSPDAEAAAEPESHRRAGIVEGPATFAATSEGLVRAPRRKARMERVKDADIAVALRCYKSRCI